MKKNKIITIASVICISLSGLVACGSNNNPEVNVDEANLSEEAKIYNEAVELYQSGNEKLGNADYEGALNDFQDAIVLVDELIQIDEIEEYTTFKEELELAIENANSRLEENVAEDNSNIENTEEDTSNIENTEEDTSNIENAEEDTSSIENAEEDTSNIENAE